LERENIFKIVTSVPGLRKGRNLRSLVRRVSSGLFAAAAVRLLLFVGQRGLGSIL
jgi:hypothetical protein